ncbi:MAG: hypothetical protein AAGE52_36550 [Myxococcota bacterium]
MRLALLSGILLACGGGGLSAGEVEDLPSGNAIGTDLSGTYELDALTVACSGSCAPIDAFGLFVTLCDVGDRNSDVAVVTQTDGVLRVDVEDNLSISRLEGGIFNDGSFEIGGVKTELGGRARFISRATGFLDADGWRGELEVRSVGSAEGQSRDCTAIVEVTGERE